MLENVVVVEPVLGTMVENVPPLVDLSISYPVIAEPPLFDGAVQERLTCDEEIVVAVNPVGDDGAVAVVDVVALAVFDGVLVPTLLIADT